jgi:hypothetical protein
MSTRPVQRSFNLGASPTRLSYSSSQDCTLAVRGGQGQPIATVWHWRGSAENVGGGGIRVLARLTLAECRGRIPRLVTQYRPSGTRNHNHLYYLHVVISGCSAWRLIGRLLTRVIKTEQSTMEASITLDGVTLTDSLLTWSPNEWPSVYREILVCADKMFWTANKPAQWTLYTFVLLCSTNYTAYHNGHAV